MTLSNSEIWRDPALPFVESRRACHSRACYKAHSHPTFSIGAVDAGLSWFTGAGDGKCPRPMDAGTRATRIWAHPDQQDPPAVPPGLGAP